MPNPLYTTNLVWDDNLNPAGAAEQWDHTFDNVEVFATAGQFAYQAAAGNGFTNGLGSNSSFSNTFMYAEQAGFKYNFDKNTFFKAAATMYTYSGTVGNSNTAARWRVSIARLPLILTGANQQPKFLQWPICGSCVCAIDECLWH